MRKLTKIIIHHSASPLTTKAADIEKWHRSRGFDGIGYHYVIESDGKIVDARPLEKIGAHCKGHNRDSIGICLVGDNTKEQRWTLKQWESLTQLVLDIRRDHGDLTIYGHRDLAPTECPGILRVAAALLMFENFDRTRKNVA